MGILLQILAFLIAVLVLVSIHEWGHFWVARRLGIKVLTYSIGFGKAIWRHVGKDGTEYVIALFPLGGYVKMLDEGEGEVPDELKSQAFNRQPVWKRFLVVLAGPMINFIFAIFAFYLVFVMGPEVIRPVIGEVAPQSIAAKAGLEPGDQIMRVDGRSTDNWQKVILGVIARMGESGTMSVVVKPQGSDQLQTKTVQLTNWNVDGLNPRPLQNMGIQPYRPKLPAVVFKVIPEGPAAKAGLKPGDKVLTVDGKPVKDWVAMVMAVQDAPGKTVSFGIERDQQHLTIPVTPEKKFVWGFQTRKFIGVGSEQVAWPADMKHKLDYSLLSAWLPAIQETWQFTSFNFIVLKKLVLGEISLRSLGGPITIYQTADRAMRQGFIVYISFLGLISTMLAFINVLPIPGLDGGHLLYYVIEIVRRKPLSIAIQTLTLRLGFILLAVIMVQATINDVFRLF